MTSSERSAVAPRDHVVERARRHLDRQIDGWLELYAGRLTAAEFVSIVSAVLAETLRTWASQQMQNERETPSKSAL